VHGFKRRIIWLELAECALRDHGVPGGCGIKAEVEVTDLRGGKFLRLENRSGVPRGGRDRPSSPSGLRRASFAVRYVRVRLARAKRSREAAKLGALAGIELRKQLLEITQRNSVTRTFRWNLIGTSFAVGMIGLQTLALGQEACTRLGARECKQLNPGQPLYLFVCEEYPGGNLRLTFKGTTCEVQIDGPECKKILNEYNAYVANYRAGGCDTQITRGPAKARCVQLGAEFQQLQAAYAANHCKFTPAQ
jgi:hypothetical protein